MTAAAGHGMISSVGENAWRPDGRAPTADELAERCESRWMTVEDVAAVEDIKPATWRWYYQRGKAGAPKPDRHRSGRPEWRVETIAEWISSRPGSGYWGRRGEREDER